MNPDSFTFTMPGLSSTEPLPCLDHGCGVVCQRIKKWAVPSHSSPPKTSAVPGRLMECLKLEGDGNVFENTSDLRFSTNEFLEKVPGVWGIRGCLSERFPSRLILLYGMDDLWLLGEPSGPIPEKEKLPEFACYLYHPTRQPIGTGMRQGCTGFDPSVMHLSCGT